MDFINNTEPNLAQEVEQILPASVWFYRNFKTGEMKEKSSQKKFEQKWCHIARQPLSQYRHPTCMTEQRDINHLTAVVVSQSCSEASARDTHPLWLKDWNQHVKSPNVSRTGREQEEGEGVCEECVCVRESESERGLEWDSEERGEAATVPLGISEQRERVLWRAMGCKDSTVADEKLAFYQT